MGTAESELEHLRRIAKFFHSIVENIPNMVFVKDAEDLRFVMFNRAGEQLLGIPRDDLLGKNDYDFFPRDEADFFRAKDMETIRGGEVVEIAEEHLLTRTHGERLLNTRKIVVTEEDGTPRYLLGISQDITARRQAERELEQLRATVAAAVVHEFRSPLQAILLQLELMRDRLHGDDAAQAAISAIRTDVSHLARLTNDMLDSTRVAIEDVPLAREIVNPAELVAQIVDGFRHRYAPHPVEVCVKGSLPEVSLDPARLEQILQNLLENAAKYAPATTPIRVELEREGAGIYLCVVDKGPGIDPSDLPRIFDRFYQSSGARERKNGFGLGLFITKGLVVAHGGRIAVESEPCQGTVFRIWFPAAR